MRCLLALGRHLSFTKAANDLYLSQSALSKRVKRMEQELEIRLFDRTTTAVVLTAAGVQVLGRAEELLRCWRKVEEAVRPDVDRPAAVKAVRLGIYAEYEDRLAAHLAEAAPGTPVTVQVMQPPEALRALADGQLDAAMIYELPGIPTHPAVSGAHVATLVSESQWVVLGRTHPLACRSTVTVGDLADIATPWFISPAGHPVHEWERTFLMDQCDRIVLRPADDATLRRIGRGDGVALASPQNVPNSELILLPLEPITVWHHYLTWMPHRVTRSDAEQILRALKGFSRRQAQRHVRYWNWLHDHPDHAADLLPDRVADRSPTRSS